MTDAPTRTLVTLLLDRSGSMQSIKHDTIGAINAYIESLKETDDDIRFSLILFDSDFSAGMELKKIHVATPVADVSPLDPSDYTPRGGTPLIDAACTTIRAVAESLQPGDGKTKVVMAIQTDGDENTSVENGWNDLKALVKEWEAEGWEFTFMGCGIDAYSQGMHMGIARDKTVSYGKDREGTAAVFAATARNTTRYASGEVGSMAYTVEQKHRAGDVS